MFLFVKPTKANKTMITVDVEVRREIFLFSNDFYLPTISAKRLVASRKQSAIGFVVDTSFSSHSRSEL